METNEKDQPAVAFRNVSKRFRMSSDHPQSILEMLLGLFRERQTPFANHGLWAVEDVSFQIMPGESVGIVGRNGSGKSTVLKLITRILRPTGGQITIWGRVSALLELGTGFHQDLTGRENIYLNGAVLGLSREEVESRFDSIVAFSELQEFIDVPVKHYSSGMYMRLGFSIAIHVDPDILIIDEILAVGDQAFQEKCVDQIYQLKRKGTTIIMVSHNLQLLRDLCSRLLWLDQGHLRNVGPTGTVAAQYLAATYEDPAQTSAPIRGGGAAPRRGGSAIQIEAVRFLDGNGRERPTFETGESLTVEIAYTAYQAVKNVEFGVAIFRQDGVQINSPNNRLAGEQIDVEAGTGVVRYIIPQLPLLSARYYVTAAIHDGRTAQAYDFHEQAYSFHVLAGAGQDLEGVLHIPASWEHAIVAEAGGAAWRETDRSDEAPAQTEALLVSETGGSMPAASEADNKGQEK